MQPTIKQYITSDTGVEDKNRLRGGGFLTGKPVNVIDRPGSIIFSAPIFAPETLYSEHSLV